MAYRSDFSAPLHVLLMKKENEGYLRLLSESQRLEMIKKMIETHNKEMEEHFSDCTDYPAKESEDDLGH